MAFVIGRTISSSSISPSFNYPIPNPFKDENIENRMEGVKKRVMKK